MSIVFDKIVIGGSLEALTYAYVHGLPALYTNLRPPFEHDRLSPGAVLDSIHFPPNVELRTASGVNSYGPAKMEVWQKLLFLLGLSGKIIYGDNVSSVNISGRKILANCGRAGKKEIDFKKLIIFDDEGVVGLPPIKTQTRYKNIVYDWVNISSGGKHEYDVLHYDTDFVRTVHFYPSHRNNNTTNKDLVAVSYLTDEQLSDFSYSDTYVKFKLLDLFKNLGIRGTRNGRDTKNPDRYKYYAVKLDPAHREVITRVENKYEKDARFIFDYQTFNDIIKKPPILDGYLSRVANLI
tara:strand:- start:1360 stop:2241 length:882 start_codon:yes stop_codon:yes gene_type:complete